MRAVKGIVENGLIRVSEDALLKEKQEVLVVVEDAQPDTPARKGFLAEELEPLLGIISLGGNALDDTERLWDEKYNI